MISSFKILPTDFGVCLLLLNLELVTEKCADFTHFYYLLKMKENFLYRNVR